MQFKFRAYLAAITASFALTACNIFNPDGAKSASCPGSDVNCYMALGQSLIQKKDFEGAMNAYNKVIAIDSTRSEAYWGYARSAVYAFNINTGDLIDDLTKAADGNVNAFMDHPDAVLTRRIRLAHQVVKVMDVFADRDTLTNWYYYAVDSTKGASDPKYAQRKAFIENYLLTSSGSRAPSRFPLMDGTKSFKALAIEYSAYKLMYEFLKLNDFGEPLLFNEDDRKFQNILNADGSFGNLEDLAEQMKEDTVLQLSVNQKILELQTGLGGIGSLLDLVGGGSGGSGSDTGGNEAQTKQKMDSTISSLGGALVFYQFGDKLDNDADGCIDEEFVDSLDNDLDGFYDEDARLLDGNGFFPPVAGATGPADGVDNDRKNNKDALDLAENKVGDELGFVAAGPSPWVMPEAKKGGSLIDYRIALQADSLAVKLDPTAPGYSVPAHLQAKLDSAKTYIGGCWRNY